MRVDIGTMENHFGEDFFELPKVQEFLTNVGHFHEIANTLAQLAETVLQENVFLRLNGTPTKTCQFTTNL